MSSADCAPSRHIGVPPWPVTTAFFDFIQHYRALHNVVKGPTAPGRSHSDPDLRGCALTGHHELFVPLVAAGLAARWAGTAKRGKQ